MKNIKAAAVLAIALAVAGCGSRPQPLEPRQTQGEETLGQTVQPSHPSSVQMTNNILELLYTLTSNELEERGYAIGYDDILADISRKYPAFGGFYYDRTQNRISIFIADTYRGTVINSLSEAERGRKLGLIRAEVLSFIQENHPDIIQNRPQVRFDRTPYSFVDLQSWRTLLRAGMGDTVNMLYIDQESRRIVIGYYANPNSLSETQRDVGALGGEQQRGRNRAIELINQLQIPSDAVKLVPSGDAILTQTLSDTPTNPVGGYAWQSSATAVFPDRTCSIGLNVTYNSLIGFLSASHCTPTVGQNDNVQAYTNGRYIGFERYDPPSQNCLWTSLPCRYADVAFFSYSVPSNRGRIARQRSFTRYDRGVDSTNPTYSVTSVILRPSQGSRLDNIGSVGGWKFGYVTSPSVDKSGRSVTGGPAFLLLDAVLMENAGLTVTCAGDSGSPWYSRNPDNTVSFAGIQSIGDGNIEIRLNQPCYSQAFFTPTTNINRTFQNAVVYTAAQ